MSRRRPRVSVGWHRDLGEVATGQVRVRNVAAETVQFEIATRPGHPPRRHRLEPGAVALVPAGYGIRRRKLRDVADYLTQEEGDSPRPAPETRPSVIEELTAGRVLPVDDPRAIEFSRRAE